MKNFLSLKMLDQTFIKELNVLDGAEIKKLLSLKMLDWDDIKSTFNSIY